MITKDEWVTWRNSEVTKYVVQRLREEIRGIQDEWSDHRFSGADEQFVMLGRTRGIDHSIQFILEDIKQELTNGD